MRKLSGYGPSLIVLATAMLVLFFGPSAVQHLTFKQSEARMIQASLRLESDDILTRINQAYSDIATFVEPAVVHLSAQQSLPDRRGFTALSSGSGWIYDEEGHVVTNYHVIRDAQRINAQMHTGQIREATIVGFDKSTDIAVVKIPPGNLHAAVRAKSDQMVKQGDQVFAFGSPFDFRFSMSSGIVSGMGRSVEVLGPSGYENFIQVDAAINPGNSGGPLTDVYGHVIGMNTAIATGRDNSLEGGQFAGIGLAIPLAMIEPVVFQIINNGGVVEKGLLGLVPDELNIGDAQRQFGFVGKGVIVGRVDPNLPAARAGVQVNDIITAVNGQSIDAPSQLRSIVSSTMPGELVELSIWRPDPANRTGLALTLAVRLSRLDPLRDNGRLPDDQDKEELIHLGIEKMQTSTQALADTLGVAFHAGVLIERLVEGSDLARDVEPGSIIVDVTGHPVADVDELFEFLRLFNLRRGVRVGMILPDGRYRSTFLIVQQ